MYYLDYCWRVPPETEPVYEPPAPIVGYSVEGFVLAHPEFKSYLEDPDLASDFLQTVLDRAATEIQYGDWPAIIQVESVYLLTAHILQRRFEQQADTATRAVRASQGSQDRFSQADTRASTQDDLMSTVYGEQLIRLQSNTRSNGGIVV